MVFVLNVSMKLIVQYLLLPLTIVSVFSTCQKGQASKGEVITQQDYMNVSYGANAAQKMDVYLPAGRTTGKTKALVFIHGGSWSGGDKADFNPSIAAIRAQLPLYAIFNINYRLANSANRFPAQINDVQAALDFITKKSDEYKISGENFVLVGASAGAHLALLQAYKNNSNGNIKAVVDLFGPTDMTALYTNHPFPSASQQTMLNLFGTTPAANASLYQQASPISFVTSKSVPTLIFHGHMDYVVPVSQSTTLKAKLESVNAKVEMKLYTGEGHGWYGKNLLDTYSRTVAFIKQNVD
ncbi:MAG TPA: alpha/beta hydrolase [Segetibacter sp.]|jgi:acetyl esterase/lipase